MSGRAAELLLEGGGGAGYGAAAARGYGADDDFNFRAQRKLRGDTVLAGTKAPFLRGNRRRMNALAVVLSLFVPWLVGVGCLWALSFKVRYAQPVLAYFVVACCVAVVVYLGVYAWWYTLQKKRRGIHDPTWYIFAFLTSLLFLLLGCLTGNHIYQNYSSKSYMSAELNMYSNVNPTRLNGQMMMDAGMINFGTGTQLDFSKTMGFRDKNMFCVAPVVYNGEAPQSYDFWIVGKDCCSGPPTAGNARSYHCGAWNWPLNRSTVSRLMNDEDRAFYRLAVQQAEAAFNIQAVHPLFFTWPSGAGSDFAGDTRGSGAGGSGGLSVGGSMSGSASVSVGLNIATGIFQIGVVIGFLIQLFLVVVASVAFSTLGQPI
eukprot:TRINITY_DN55512_c0_g1_i1.p1 TRINITY_DN55512_c0_g1~~TRINITY_DN55512_c0_g1_i1.p1  ORF type:complete len:410 (+),score=73.06 TRINITY_DN55512_c0_g1_i1:112-1230(+)